MGPLGLEPGTKGLKLKIKKLKKPLSEHYDLWGDVVNTASRMESHGTAGRIQLSESTRQALIQPFSIEHRGVIDVKGKGEMSTWFLNKRAVN